MFVSVCFVCVCVCLCLSVCVCLFDCACSCLFVFGCFCLFEFVCMFVFVCLFVFVHACLFACAFVCLDVCLFACVLKVRCNIWLLRNMNGAREQLLDIKSKTQYQSSRLSTAREPKLHWLAEVRSLWYLWGQRGSFFLAKMLSLPYIIMCSLYCDWNYSLLKPTKPDLHFTTTCILLQYANHYKGLIITYINWLTPWI